MTLDQCLGANRPLIFAVTESDVEILNHIDKNYPENDIYVYSTTITNIIPIKQYLSPTGSLEAPEALSTVAVLNQILNNKFPGSSRKLKTGFTTVVLLDCDSYINDPQVVRKIKDILFKYQINEEFTINLLCLSHKVCVPSHLERLAEMVFYDLPNEQELKECSDSLVKKLELKGEAVPSEEIISNLKGMTTFEAEQAYLQSHYLYKRIDLTFIREFKKNAIAKTDLLSLMETNTSFNEVGGLDRLKEWIKKSAGGWTVEGRKFGLPNLKGILMVGLPGCGKSLVAKSLGTEWGLPVVEFDPGRVFSSRVGDSETNMRRALQIVNNLAPCILMIDEIEKAFSGLHSSSYSDAGVTARVIRSFLVWMQDNERPVFTIATANNISMMPPEMISRFDETFFVNLPQLEERRDIFSIHIKKLNREPDKYDINALAEKSQDMSGREIEQSLREAMYDCFHANTDLKTEAILSVLEKKTTLVTTMAEQLKKLIEWVGWSDVKKDGLRARYASNPDPNDTKRVKDAIEDMLKSLETPNTGQGTGPVA